MCALSHLNDTYVCTSAKRRRQVHFVPMRQSPVCPCMCVCAVCTPMMETIQNLMSQAFMTHIKPHTSTSRWLFCDAHGIELIMGKRIANNFNKNTQEIMRMSRRQQRKQHRQRPLVANTQLRRERA